MGEPSLKPFINAVSALASFTIESNVAYFVTPTENVHKSSSNDNTWYVTTRDLKFFLSSYDWGFGTLNEAREKDLYFLAHIPPSYKRPLYVTRENELNIEKLSNVS